MPETGTKPRSEIKSVLSAKARSKQELHEQRVFFICISPPESLSKAYARQKATYAFELQGK